MNSSPTPFRGSWSAYTRQQLRARRFRRLGRDVYVLVPGDDDLPLRAQAAVAALPDAVVSHATAARLLRLPGPPDPPVHLVRAPGRAVSRRAGVVTHRAEVRADEVVRVRGLAVTSPTRTFLDLAAVLDPVGLAVLGDAVARRVGVPALQRAVDGAGGRRGAVRARSALRRVDPGSDSPAETRTRLLLHDAGFPDLRHQCAVRDRSGGWVSRPDLADEGARVAVQYDGLVHLQGGPARWRADIDRDEQTRAAGWEVVVLTARDLSRPELAVGKVTAAYSRAAARS